jgi:uncharacterized protein YajQ (UPF0234 family)
MAKKIKIDTPNVDIEKDGKNLKITIDTKNVDITYIKDELNKEFIYDGKNIDIDIKKTPEGLDVKVDAKPGICTLIAKRIVKLILKRFKK